mmetsp:Transcript_5264/g.16923  ORF Transcript_5264/g.16923 Transcript_5264/m.16923 type:complete len:451 (-) Transcript_5264:711-2063(-)
MPHRLLEHKGQLQRPLDRRRSITRSRLQAVPDGRVVAASAGASLVTLHSIPHHLGQRQINLTQKVRGVRPDQTAGLVSMPHLNDQPVVLTVSLVKVKRQLLAKGRCERLVRGRRPHRELRTGQRHLDVRLRRAVLRHSPQVPRAQHVHKQPAGHAAKGPSAFGCRTLGDGGGCRLGLLGEDGRDVVQGSGARSNDQRRHGHRRERSLVPVRYPGQDGVAKAGRATLVQQRGAHLGAKSAQGGPSKECEPVGVAPAAGRFWCPRHDHVHLRHAAELNPVRVERRQLLGRPFALVKEDDGDIVADQPSVRVRRQLCRHVVHDLHAPPLSVHGTATGCAAKVTLEPRPAGQVDGEAHGGDKGVKGRRRLGHPLPSVVVWRRANQRNLQLCPAWRVLPLQREKASCRLSGAKDEVVRLWLVARRRVGRQRVEDVKGVLCQRLGRRRLVLQPSRN